MGCLEERKTRCFPCKETSPRNNGGQEMDTHEGELKSLVNLVLSVKHSPAYFSATDNCVQGCKMSGHVTITVALKQTVALHAQGEEGVGEGEGGGGKREKGKKGGGGRGEGGWKDSQGITISDATLFPELHCVINDKRQRKSHLTKNLFP